MPHRRQIPFCLIMTTFWMQSACRWRTVCAFQRWNPRLLSTSRFASTLSETLNEDAQKINEARARIIPEGPIPTVVLKRNKQSRSFRDGSQLVFSRSIAQVPSSLRLADLVRVEVEDGQRTQLVGLGVYNPDSMYRIRLLSHATLNPNLKIDLKKVDSTPESLMESILTKQMHKANHTRVAMGLPSDMTDTYRLINGEGDGLSGLAVDIIGDQVAVIMSSAAWCQIHQATILKCLGKVLPDHELIWKTTPSRLQQDGLLVEDSDDEEDTELATSVIGTENGIKYETFPHSRGQKTSVYCDQRENRWNLAQLCKGKRVLDLCCYHGGFSLNAASQGATRVVGVDSSQEAVDTCYKNAELNGLSDSVEFVRSDINDFMKNCEDEFDVVVLDPPKLAPSASGLAKASRKYHAFNRDAIKLVDEKKGGLLLTCTCSAAMTQKEGGAYFLNMFQQASLAAKREVTLLRVSGAAPCHTQSPISIPAGNYLTAALFHVHAKE